MSKGETVHMKKSKFTEIQIVKVLKESEAGCSVDDILREKGIRKLTFYHWKKQYSGMNSSQLSDLKALIDVNAWLYKM